MPTPVYHLPIPYVQASLGRTIARLRQIVVVLAPLDEVHSRPFPTSRILAGTGACVRGERDHSIEDERTIDLVCQVDKARRQGTGEIVDTDGIEA